MPKPKRPRTARREAARKLSKLAEDRERLFALEAGGSAERPIEVGTPSVIDVRARSVPCPRCGGEHEMLEHAAVTTEHGSLREARLRCRQCASRRSIWFRLVTMN
jgi:hypothetical protein